MTDPSTDEHAAADAQRVRVEALRQRRAPRVDGSASLAPATGRAPRRRHRRHAAGRSRVGVAAFSVATMLGLVGVMGLARPESSATPAAPVDTTAAPLPAPTSAATLAAPAATAAPGPAVAAPPVALTARPTVQVTTPTSAASVARTNGSH